NILFCTDGSIWANAAERLLTRLPLPEAATITVLAIIPDDNPFAMPERAHDDTQKAALEALRQTAHAIAEEQVASHAANLLRTGCSVKRRIAVGDVPETILQTAQTERVDLIVMGTLGTRAKGRIPLGSTARRVVKHAHCSVLLARPPDYHAEKNSASDPEEALEVLLGFDGSAPAKAAVDLLASLPLGDRARITLLSVLLVGTTLYRRDIQERLSDAWREYRQRSSEELEVAARTLRQAAEDVEPRLVDGGGNATDELLEAIELLNADLVVVGHAGKTGIRRFLLGSVSGHLVEHAPCSVLVVRAPDSQ
ncbi:MAG: universal stress protein, partial [Pseudomonadota bacterium]|nr:universal stress protein [Pseudomonadota bacterium]